MPEKSLPQRPCARCGRLFEPVLADRRYCSLRCQEAATKPGFADPEQPGNLLSVAERQALVVQWLGLAWKLAKHYGGRHPTGLRNAQTEDLFQEAVLGLIRAAHKWQPARGNKFSTYAWYWIRQSISRALMGGSLVRLPSHWRLGQADGGARGRGRAFLGRARATQQVGALPDGDLLAGPAQEPSYQEQEMASELAEALKALPTSRRRVLELRFGLGDGQQRSLEEVGAELGVSKERVRQIQFEALQRVRQSIEGTSGLRLPQCRQTGRAPCLRRPLTDGFCERHHPQTRLAILQKCLRRLWDECEREENPQDWDRYCRLERRERKLLAEVEAITVGKDTHAIGATSQRDGSKSRR